MTRLQARATKWHRLRALVLAAVVFVGGFGLPAFDVLAYHWHQPAAAAPDGLPHLQQLGTPAEHAVQCALTHNAPAPRLAQSVSATAHAVGTTPAPRSLRPAAIPPQPSRHAPDQPRAPPSSIA